MSSHSTPSTHPAPPSPQLQPHLCSGQASDQGNTIYAIPYALRPIHGPPYPELTIVLIPNILREARTAPRPTTAPRRTTALRRTAPHRAAPRRTVRCAPRRTAHRSTAAPPPSAHPPHRLPCRTTQAPFAYGAPPAHDVPPADGVRTSCAQLWPCSAARYERVPQRGRPPPPVPPCVRHSSCERGGYVARRAHAVLFY